MLVDKFNAQAYAEKLGIDIHTEYKGQEAAKIMRVGINALNKAANDNELACIRIGIRRKLFLGLDLIEWRLKKRTESENSTSQKTVTESGAERGTAPNVNNDELTDYALRIFTKPKKS